MKKTTMLSIGLSAALFASNAFAFSDEEITIWMPMDKGSKGLTVAINNFVADTGINVKVAYPESLEQRYVQVASTGKGPDIIVFAHDRFGGYAEAGLIRELKPSKPFMDKFESFTWNAMKYNGALYGYPIAIEAISLIYNKDLIKEPLKNWEDIFTLEKELNKKGIKAISWETTSPYFSHPLFTSDGAYVFKETENGFNAKDIGVNTPQAKSTMKFIKQIVDGGIISKDMDYSRAESAFVNGEVAMTINGPWAWVNMDKVSMNYGLTVLPKFNGKPSRPFVGILSAGINTASPNESIATEFIENYLLSYESLDFMNKQVPIGSPALKALAQDLHADARVTATLENAKNGDIMPNIPQIIGYWHGLNEAITNVLDERQSVDNALSTLEERLISH